MVSKCLDCGKGVTTRSKAVQCSFCDGWLHITCCGISPNFYECLLMYTASSVGIFCDSCLTLVNTQRAHSGLPAFTPRSASAHSDPQPTVSQNSPSSFPSLCPDFVTPVLKQISAPPSEPHISSDQPSKPLPKTFATVVKENTVAAPASRIPVVHKCKPIAKAVEDKASPPKRGLKSVLHRIDHLEKLLQDKPPSKPRIPEIAKVPNRERCLIIMNSPESDKTTAAERILDDQLFLKRMISLLFDEGEPGINIVSAFRLGRKHEDSSKVRPLKVVCQTEDECRRILRRTSRLKGEPFHVLRDLSPEDRVKMKIAVDELRTRRANGETDLRIEDFRVVRKVQRTRWKPVLVLPGH
ncbi:unnamed protein product [Dicrocoelium dendriticum]|nr:unnamed protein product [Dicrocoelium dendriticum]